MQSSVAEKVKRHVLIFASAKRSIGFLINSKPSPLVRSKPDWISRQVLMPVNDHTFMEHDSYIACHDTVALPTYPLLAEGIANEAVEYLGQIDISLHKKIVGAAHGSKLIAQRDVELIVSSFKIIDETIELTMVSRKPGDPK